MPRNRPALFEGRHFEAEIIILCVRLYLRFGLSVRNLEELMVERKLRVNHVTTWRWVQRYAPELHRGCRPQVRMTNRSWRCDETYLCFARKWTYLYRAVDSTGATIAFFCLPDAMPMRPSVSFRRLCALRAILVHGSSMWTAIRHTRRPLLN